MKVLRDYLLLYMLVGLILTSGAAFSCAQRRVFSGHVTDQEGKPVAKALVEVSGRRTLTATDGSFRLRVPNAELYLLNLSHPDFADFSYITRTLLTSQTWRLVRAQIETVDPMHEIILTDRRGELGQKGLRGARIVVPANALVDNLGSPPTGTVRAAIATLDVANGEVPGDWAVRSGNREGYLVSYGAAFVQFTDPTGGVVYQLASGRRARIWIPVIPTMSAHVSSAPTAQFWNYDRSDGYWKETGSARWDPQTQTYLGEIDHLSTINTDIAKFDNAACLKITLDGSVPTGLKLRIRYHSSGTPFGQTPTFVMNDTTNAAYRLPANTNVLLELLSASDEVFGNLVVEDPPGTATINNVINTGPALPPGESLWPPPPFNPCKPVALRLGLPQVEIQINVLPAAVAKDNPTDDYVTWAPTFCRARLTSGMGAPVTAVLTNDDPARIPDGGDILFAAYQDPWPANTTATQNTLTLVLPGDGSWAPFVIAGKFGKPSTNDKDAIIDAHLNTASGAVLGTKPLMVRVRKNANDLTPSERDRFLFAYRALRLRVGSGYLMFQELHRLATTAGDEAHMQPAFFPWHRALLLQVERELQKIDPSVALPYWNWDAAAPNIFAANFMGAPGSGSFIAEPVFAASNPLNGWNTDLPFQGGELRRNTTDHTLAPVASVFKPLDHPVDPSLVDWDDFGPTTPGFSAVNSFSDDGEKRSHNPAHGWPCAGGHLTRPMRSAADPLFYLLHSQVERQWAYWQWKNNRFGVISAGTLTFPAPAHYDNTGAWNDPGNSPDPNFRQKGSFLEDGMWPWDGTTGGTPGTVEERPVNQATSPGTNIPLSMPMVPMMPFPTSLRANLWPSAPTAIKVRHVIDYLGKFRPQDGLGFCYDDVPY